MPHAKNRADAEEKRRKTMGGRSTTGFFSKKKKACGGTSGTFPCDCQKVDR